MSTQTMSQETMSLAELQRQMAAAIMMPLTEDEDMRAQAPDGRLMTAAAASFIAPNSRLTPFERLEIYNRQYWYRVLDALAEDFPVLRAAVGSRAFHGLSIEYLTAHPSRSFTLRNLGSKLPEWLAAHPGWAGRRQRLALDVVRIEWAFVEAFDNAERTPLTLDQIATLDGGSRLGLQPHLQLLALDYAADDIVLALHKEQKGNASEAGVKHEEGSAPPAKLPRLRRRPTWVAAHRLDNAVYYRRLEREEFHTLAALRDGLPLGEALEAGFRDSAKPDARRPALVRAWFGHWAELGWICAPELDSLVDG
ncbi:MAG TPA: DNA-binding domain-containing protein [Terracidiphilus sp.]|nr:DNA-binding domain-containing protein [Terracidiphilus sp.]